MELTGKCKEDFRRYRTQLILGFNNPIISKLFTDVIWVLLPSSMKLGVLIDFADSVGFVIEIQHYSLSNVFDFEINKREWNTEDGYSRPKARTKAIERFNELYNNKLAS